MHIINTYIIVPLISHSHPAIVTSRLFFFSFPGAFFSSWLSFSSHLSDTTTITTSQTLKIISFFSRPSLTLHSLMALLVISVFILAIVGGSDATWCVCRSDVSDTALQKTLDYACGAGADCSPVLQNGVCFQPNTVRSHCSYAANSYFQRKGQAAGACDFSGTATVSSTDPSYGTCSFPATLSAAGTGTSTSSSSSTNQSGTTTSTTPNPFNSPTNGVLGGLGPSGTSITTDGSDGSFLPKPGAGSLFTATIITSGLLLLRGFD